jgi:hypothetical protein
MLLCNCAKLRDTTQVGGRGGLSHRSEPLCMYPHKSLFFFLNTFQIQGVIQEYKLLLFLNCGALESC